MDGILNIYKEKGYTSHDVVAIVRRLLKVKRVGHAGTLDPDATGVLLVLVGKATKLSNYLMDSGKEYRATVKFGVSTDTYDASGNITATGSVDFTRDELEEAVSGFIGELEQLPPMYSAVKKDGKKLCDLARKGIEVERAARKVVIKDIIIEEFKGLDKAVLYIKCGKGTYVRSICHDLGVKLGCGAYMAALERTSSGVFLAKGAIRLDDLKAASPERMLLPIESALIGYNSIKAPAKVCGQLYNGARINVGVLGADVKTEDINVLSDDKGRLIGIYETVHGEDGSSYLKPKTMLWGGGE